MKRGLEYLQSDAKRRFDLAGGLLVGAAVSPIFAGVACASIIDTQNLNPLIAQDRLGGKAEATFRAWKFRTLRKQAESAPFQTFGTFDPRATRLGLFIRQAGLDELPQLANILIGNMALVGPRPLVDVDIDRNQSAAPRIFDDWYEYFKAVKPGLVGEAQIYRHHYRSTTPSIIAQSMEMELRYFESASLREDMKWLLTSPAGMVNANVHVIENVLDEAA